MKSLETCRVNVMITDMNRAVEFYRDTLGMQLLNRYGDHYAEIQAPDLLIGLHPGAKQSKLGNNLSIGLGVTAFDEAVNELKEQGIELRIENEGWVRLAYFSDPDGNQLFLAERKG